jgi:hypothetical protein
MLMNDAPRRHDHVALQGTHTMHRNMSAVEYPNG